MIRSVHFMTLALGASLEAVLQHWYEVHGRHHVGPGTRMSSYTQVHTLTSAYGGAANPTHVGASIVGYKDLATMSTAREAPSWRAASEDSRKGLGGQQLFTGPPMIAVGQEKIQKDGATIPLMVNAITMVNYNPDLPRDEVVDFWGNVAGPTAAKLPGLRRYVQNHGIKEARDLPNVTRDAWTEMWFDDLPSFLAALSSPEAEQMRKTARAGLNGKPLFDPASRGFVIGRERKMLTPAQGGAS